MTDLEFGVLGPLEAVRDGQPVVIGAPKVRVVLAALLLEANAVVSVDRLVDRLWGEHPPVSARKSVQLYVLRLRRSLGAAGLIQTRPDGYLMRLAPDKLDLLRFRRLCEGVREAERSGDLAAELNGLTEALACWRGPALSDVPSESLQREVVAQLAEDRLRATERQMHVQLALGRHREVISDLVQLTKDHPWQEPFWAQLIVALHRSGRLGDALRTYRTVRDRLAAELGVEPGPELRQAHAAILSEQLGNAGEEPAEARSTGSPVCQLPPDVRSFVGRAEAIGELTGLARAAGSRTPQVVVLSGPPGVGKTALAVHVAHLLRREFADGQLYVNLQGHAADPALTPDAVLARFLRALGVPRAAVPTELEDQAALYRSVLAGRGMLLLLDNAAHVDQVRPLLPGEPACVVLVTSRHDLRGLTVRPGAEHLRLDVLSPEESIALITNLIGPDRAAAEPDAVAQLATTCGHLPLALRIAGANLAADPYRGTADYTALLRRSDRLAELAVDGDERSAVRVAFDQSYLCLSTADRRLFRLLGLAPGPDIGAAAVAALADASPQETARALDRLAAANLLHQHAPGRHQFHDLIREYAADRANAEDPAETITEALTRLVDHYLNTARVAAGQLYPGMSQLSRNRSDQPTTSFRTESTALHWLDAERYTMLATVAWAATHPHLQRFAWQLVDVLRGYLQARGHAGEALAGVAAALRAAARAGDRAAELSLLDLLGVISQNLSDYRGAIGFHRRSLFAARELHNRDVEAHTLHNLGRAYTRQGRPRQAERRLRQALAASREAGNAHAEALAMNAIGLARTYLGDPRDAISWHNQSLALSERENNRTACHHARNGRGIARWALGQLDDARADHEQVLAYCRETGHGIGETASLNCLAELHCDAGRLDLAMTQATESLRRSVQLGERRCESTALEIISRVHDRLGDHHTAQEGFTQALRLAREIGYGFGETSALIGLAATHRAMGDPEQGRTLCEKALSQVREDEHLLFEPLVLTELAHAHLDLGDPTSAARLIEQAVHTAGQRELQLFEQRARRVRQLIPSSVRSRSSNPVSSTS